MECAGLTALLFLWLTDKSGVKLPHPKERSLYTILLTKRQSKMYIGATQP